MAIISLLTDYATRDGYVAALKGVIAGIAPEAQVVDITHEVPPYGVAHAAFVLGQVWRWFPLGTIHVAVVDPGVGSARRILLGEFAGQFALAPDNGLLTFVHHDHPPGRLWSVENADYSLPESSPTFHGRDILAPVAAHLALGVDPSSVGPATDDLERLPIPPRAERHAGGWRGQVIHVDRFGTLVSNIHRDQLPKAGGDRDRLQATVDGTAIGPVRRSFHEVPVGEPLALLGGSGFLEVAVNQGRAVERFDPGLATRVEVR